MRRRIFDEPGHAHFLTFSCAARRQLLNQDRCKRIVIHHLEAVRTECEGICFGFVLMPEHVHVLVRFKEPGQLNLFKQEWKRRSSVGLLNYFRESGNPIVEHLIRDDGTHRIWTPKQYDFNVFTHEKAWEKLQYMHENPVKRGLITNADDWAFSSARWYSNRKSVGVTLTHLDE